MTSVGFTAMKLYGSVWQFQPARLDAQRNIQFYEPHPRSKLPCRVALHYTSSFQPIEIESSDDFESAKERAAEIAAADDKAAVGDTQATIKQEQDPANGDNQGQEDDDQEQDVASDYDELYD